MQTSSALRGQWSLLALVISGCVENPIGGEDAGSLPEVGVCSPNIIGGSATYRGRLGSFDTTVNATWNDDPTRTDSVWRFNAAPGVLLATFEGRPEVGAEPVPVLYTESGSWRSSSGGLVFDAVEGAKVTLHMEPTRMIPSACLAAKKNCGNAPEICDGTVSCGTCEVNGETCGGGSADAGGTPNVCGAGACQKLPTCGSAGVNCGFVSDGCGGTLACGSCKNDGERCGNPDGGSPNVCWKPACTVTTCAQEGKNCGQIFDGCGNILQCGACTVAGGRCFNNRCVTGLPACSPRTCAQQGLNCGVVSDGCSNLLSCGSCAAGAEACGRVTPNVCDLTEGPACTTPSGAFLLEIPTCQANVAGL